jgi:glycine cleavage system protein P-like pyridoxal-binding family
MRSRPVIYCLAILSSMLAIRSPAGEAPDMSGAELYKSFCAPCHGVQGHGDGPVAPSLKQRPADLTLLAQRGGGVFSAEKVHRMIDGRAMPRAHGSSDMPVWGWEFYGYEGEDATRRRRVAEFIDQLVDYLQSIQSPLK